VVLSVFSCYYCEDYNLDAHLNCKIARTWATLIGVVTSDPRKIVRGRIVAPLTSVSGDSYLSVLFLRPADDSSSNTGRREKEREEKERDGSWC
jgi:hypothetical protein